MNQGAIQLDITINNQSISIARENIVSFNITRVIGDAADEFTLEVFDESAWKIENALMPKDFETGKFPPILVKYASSDGFSNKTVLFSGTCLSYQLAFSGRSTMITITGILAASASSSGYWFERNSIEWCGMSPDVDDSENIIGIDGKSFADIAANLENDDVCAILVYKKNAKGKVDSVPTPFFNPTRIFKRIIKKYNGDIIGLNNGEGMGAVNSSGYFLLDNENIDECCWIEGVNCIQSDETAAQFIQGKLATMAVGLPSGIDTSTLYADMLINNRKITLDNQPSGYMYSVSAKGHAFKKINYTDKTTITDKIKISYGQQDSTVISFAIGKVGAMAMAGCSTDANGNVLSDISSIDSMSETGITVSSLTGDPVTDDTVQNAHWYSGKVSALSVNSSLSPSGLTALLSNTWNKLINYTISAELTLWGQYSKTYAPRLIHRTSSIRKR